MRREWDPEDLIACWTLLGDDWARVGNKTGATRLGFALLLKYFGWTAASPARRRGAEGGGGLHRRAGQGRCPAVR
jgi:hypothetical protein